MSRKKIVVGLSGGVDSSFTAWLLAREGFDVQAMFMKNWDADDEEGFCPAREDLEDAMAVCEHLEIPLHKRNFAREYWDRVFEHFLAEHRAGRTPNPDVLCNREIKFGVFLQHALALGAEKVATGHYARVDCVDGRYRLLKGVDENKDQSYFLHALNQAQLAHALFPLGGWRKDEVRAAAREAGLPTFAKKDSTGICFVGERRFDEFLRRFIQPCPGEMQTPDGRVVGTHQGLMFYTLGQRKGLGIGGDGAPWYVVGKRHGDNVLVVAQGHDHPLLYSRRLRTGPVHWIAGETPALPLRCAAKARYRQPDQACTVLPADGGCEVVFDVPQRALTTGQSVVFYDGEECLGGAVIQSVEGVIYE